MKFNERLTFGSKQVALSKKNLKTTKSDFFKLKFTKDAEGALICRISSLFESVVVIFAIPAQNRVLSHFCPEVP